jgi:hypothetical protein
MKSVFPIYEVKIRHQCEPSIQFHELVLEYVQPAVTVYYGPKLNMGHLLLLISLRFLLLSRDHSSYLEHDRLSICLISLGKDETVVYITFSLLMLLGCAGSS